MSSGNIVKLDIGGTVFKTSKSTLTKFDGFFKVLLETDVPLKKDDTVCIFIDRDPQHFRLILNFMRDGDVILPKIEEDILEIQKEAQYYLLTDLVELCNANILVRTKISKKINVIESESEYLQIITSPTKAVLIIYYPNGSNGFVSYPDGFDAKSFLEKHEIHFDIYFKQNKNEDRFWMWSLHKKNKRMEFSMRGARGPFTKVVESIIDYFLQCTNLI